jgi:hypothetical protein
MIPKRAFVSRSVFIGSNSFVQTISVSYTVPSIPKFGKSFLKESDYIRL